MRGGRYEAEPGPETVSYFKNNMAEVLRRLNEIRVHDHNAKWEAKAAIMDIQAYEELQETLAMLEMIAQGSKACEGRYGLANRC